MPRVHNLRSGIYLITVDCGSSGKKFYIGKAKDTLKRWREHLKHLRENRHANIYMQRAFLKHGETRFTFSILEESSERNTSHIEQKHLDSFCKKYGTERVYNIRKMCVDTRLGVAHTDAVRQILSDKQKINWEDPEYRDRLCTALKAAKTPELIARIVEAQRKKLEEPGQREKLSAIAREVGARPETSAKRKAANKRPEVIAKRRESALKALSTPEAKANMSAAQNRPDVNARRSASIKAFHARRKAEERVNAD